MARDREWHYGRTRLGSLINVVLAAIVVIVAVYIGATRNPLAYAVALVGAFMFLLFCAIARRAWSSPTRDRR